MPLVTDLWFTALDRILLWRSAFMLTASCSFGLFINAPIIWRGIGNFGIGWRVAGCALPATAIISAWRWYHWRKVQEANIFPDTSRTSAGRGDNDR